MTSFTNDLEQRCSRIVRKTHEGETGPTPATFVVREMALVLDRLDRIRCQAEDEARRSKRRELDLGSQILNLEDQIDRVPDWRERTRIINELKQMRDHVQSQSHRLSWEINSETHRLHIRLLELWNMHDQLAEQYGNPASAA